MSDALNIFDEDGDFDDEKALAYLLLSDVVLVNSIKHNDEWHITCFVLCNDLFAWALADAEAFGMKDLEAICAAHKAGAWGVDKWCCHHRNMKPQRPCIDMMKKAGVWDDAMEALPENWYDMARKKEMQEKAEKEASESVDKKEGDR